MKQILLLLTLCFIGMSGYAQESEYRYDVRLGIGSSLLGTGDMQTIMLENEVNYMISDMFAVAGGLGFGMSDKGVSKQTALLQVNTAFYVSPFLNVRRNDFRIGTGLSWYTVSETFVTSSNLQSTEHAFERRSSLGGNIIVENTYAISRKVLVGVKLFTQPYLNGDINSGILLKVGIKI